MGIIEDTMGGKEWLSTVGCLTLKLSFWGLQFWVITKGKE